MDPIRSVITRKLISRQQKAFSRTFTAQQYVWRGRQRTFMLDSSTLLSRHSPRPGSQRRDPWEYKKTSCAAKFDGATSSRTACYTYASKDAMPPSSAMSRCAEVHGCKGGRAPGVRWRAAEELLFSARRDSLKFSVIMRTRRDTNERLHRNTMTAEMRPAIIG